MHSSLEQPGWAFALHRRGNGAKPRQTARSAVVGEVWGLVLLLSSRSMMRSPGIDPDWSR
jgi:hypothetical protein